MVGFNTNHPRGRGEGILAEDLRAVNLVVRGRVQGVWFRASARDEALARGLGGWVRNLADGSVELRAEGPAPALEELIGWCRRGPPLAQVSHVEVQWVFAQGMEGFRILRP